MRTSNNRYLIEFFFILADGLVATIDMRAMDTPVVQQFRCFEASIPTLSHHPTNENLILASCVNGYNIP